MEEKAPLRSKKSSNKTAKIVIVVAAIFALVAAVALLLLNGTTTTTSRTTSEKSTSVVCSSKTVDYPKFTNTGAGSSELKFTLIFRSDTEIDSIGMLYTLYYASAAEVSGAESSLHAQLNKALGASGFDNSSAFSNKFNQFEDRLTLTLFASASEITSRAAPYFMLQTDSDNNLSLSSKSDYVENYQKQGFSCQEND